MHLKHNRLTAGNVFTKMNTNINPAQVLFYLKSWTFGNLFCTEYIIYYVVLILLFNNTAYFPS